MEKSELRQIVIKERDQLLSSSLEEKSKLISSRVVGLNEYLSSKVIMFYISFGSEVKTRFMIRDALDRGKQVLVPKTVPKSKELVPSQLLDMENDLEPGVYNIPEPKKSALRPRRPQEIDLLIIPGVAFNPRGDRLGYGGGYYDRFNQLLKSGVKLLAPAFELQIYPDIPIDHWDRPVDIIVTEDRVIFTNSLEV